MKSLILALTLSVTPAFAAVKSEVILNFANGVSALLLWEKGPSVLGESVLRVEFLDSRTSKPVDILGRSEISFNMPASNHRAPKPTINLIAIENGKVTPGVYRASNIRLQMDGEWFVTIRVPNADGSVFEQSASFLVGNPK